MATFNAELAAKALEKRLAGLEAAIDAIQKQGRAAGDFAAALPAMQKQLADQKQRVETLEKLVKTLTETRGDSKGDAMQKIQQTLKEVQDQRLKDRNDLKVDMDKRIEALRKLGVDVRSNPQEVTKLVDQQIRQAQAVSRSLAEAEDKRQKQERQRQAEADRAEIQRQVRVDVEKALRESERQVQQAAERSTKALVETQLAVLTARLNVLEGRVKK